MPVGLLDIRLEVIPRTQEILTEDVIAAQTSLEKGKRAERERLFLIYAKQWWKEYLQIRQAHKDRLVKIFAQVFCYVQQHNSFTACFYNILKLNTSWF